MQTKLAKNHMIPEQRQSQKLWMLHAKNAKVRPAD